MLKERELNIDIGILPEFQREWKFARLQAWFVNALDVTPDTMIYKKSMESQVLFVRDNITNLLGDLCECVDVISYHTSKSINLPVYKITLANGVELIMRDNFYDWKVSVKSPKDLEFPFPTNLFSNGCDEDIHYCYCEGFEKEWVYPSYKKSKSEFTVELNNNYDLYTFMFLLKNQIKLR
jgi:hypothetical protein